MTRIVLSGLLLLAALLGPLQAAEARVAATQVNGVSLVYEIEGSGEPLVLIHGWAVHCGFWDGDVERFASRYTVIRYDRRGFGESSAKPDITADPADLKALLETLGYPRVHIMGHSQGAAAALTFAVRYPEMVDALILFGAGPPAGFDLPPGEDAPAFEEWVALAREQGVDALKDAMSAWAAQHFGERSADVAERSRALLELYTGLDLIDPPPPSHLAEPARVDELGSVRAPTLVINGQHEMPGLRIVADVLTYGIPGARKVVIPGGGHIVNWTEPERFAAEVLRFLRGARDTSGDP